MTHGGRQEAMDKIREITPRGRAGMGRPKGAKNRITATVKQALEESFHEGGGKQWLIELMHNDPATYAKLLLRLIPQEQVITNDDDGNPIAYNPDADIDGDDD